MKSEKRTSPEVKEISVAWFNGASDSGCTVSILNAVNPTIKNVLIDLIRPGYHLNLRFQSTIMAGSGELAVDMLREEKLENYILVVEGAIPTADGGIYGTVGEEEGKPITIQERVLDLADRAVAVIALGTCASFGGIFAAAPNPTGCQGIGDTLRKAKIYRPVINIPGCPPHPDWFIKTVIEIIHQGLDKVLKSLDELGRPKSFYGQLIHDLCPRRPYFDLGKFAEKIGEEGCLYYLGCKGPLTYADCPIRGWNNQSNWCVMSGGPCEGCAMPEFPDLPSPLYQKIVQKKLPGIRKDTDTKKLKVYLKGSSNSLP